MESSDIQVLQVLQETRRLLEKSVRLATKEKFEQARDCCIKGMALVDLIRKSTEYEKLLLTCHRSMEELCYDLRKLLSEQSKNVTRIEAKGSVPTKAVGVVSATSSVDNMLPTISSPPPAVAKPPPEQQAMKPFTFDQIIGCELAKQMLYENIVLPLSLSNEEKKMFFAGIRAGTGNVLLHGPPGTGKTLLAQVAARTLLPSMHNHDLNPELSCRFSLKKATASEAGAVMFSIRPSDVLSKYQGESERYLRTVFEEARTVPCGRAVIFFDEFDSIALARGGADEGAQARRLLSELLLQLTHNKQLQMEQREMTNTATSTAAPPLSPVASCAATDDDTNTKFGDTLTSGNLKSPLRRVLPRKRSFGDLLSGESQDSSLQSSQSSDDEEDDDGEHTGGVMTLSPRNAANTKTLRVSEAAQTPQTPTGTTNSNATTAAHVVVIAATNRLEDLDEAVLRRFESKIYVGVPEKTARCAMIHTNLQGIDSSLSAEDMAQVVELTYGWSGSDIETLCREAAMAPVREILSYTALAGRGGCMSSKRTVSYGDDEEADVDVAAPSGSQRSVATAAATAATTAAAVKAGLRETARNSLKRKPRPVCLGDFVCAFNTLTGQMSNFVEGTAVGDDGRDDVNHSECVGGMCGHGHGHGHGHGMGELCGTGIMYEEQDEEEQEEEAGEETDSCTYSVSVVNSDGVDSAADGSGGGGSVMVMNGDE